MTTLAQPVGSDLLATMNPKAATAAGTAADAQNRFMTLLVTQMKNQDPLNPLDNAQVTSQLAQLSTVTGIDKLNETMKTMMQSAQASQSLQAAAMIGHGVLVPDGGLSLAGGKSVYGIELAGPADAVQVTISDSAGNPVRSIELGAQPQGALALAWDGRLASGAVAADGRYQLSVSAVRGGAAVSAQPLAFGEVLSVSTGSGGPRLNLGVGLGQGQGQVALSDVRQIL